MQTFVLFVVSVVLLVIFNCARLQQILGDTTYRLIGQSVHTSRITQVVFPKSLVSTEEIIDPKSCLLEILKWKYISRTHIFICSHLYVRICIYTCIVYILLFWHRLCTYICVDSHNAYLLIYVFPYTLYDICIFWYQYITVKHFELDVVPTPRPLGWFRLTVEVFPPNRCRYWGPASWVRFLHGPHVPWR